jgi:signal transduction histidine kinase
VRSLLTGPGSAALGSGGAALVEEVRSAFGGQVAGVAIADGEFLLVHAIAGYSEAARGRLLPARAGQFGKVLADGRARVVEDLAAPVLPVPGPPLRSGLYAPAVVGRTRVVVWVEARGRHAFVPGQAAALGAVAAVVAGREEGRSARGERRDQMLLRGLERRLRSAVTVLLGAAGTLRERDSDLDEDTRAAVLAGAQRAQRSLSSVADGLGVAAALARGTLTSAPQILDLGRLTDGAGTGVRVNADPRLVAWVLAELADNAARHAGGATIAVRPEGAAVAVELRDRGPGLPGPVADALRTHRPPAGGLGLYLADALATATGGDLRLAAAPDDGTVATLYLPAG